MARIKIGLVTHYYPKMSVAVIKLTGSDLKIGDTIIFSGKNEKEKKQKVVSMQIEHANIDLAREGDEFGLMTDFRLKAKTEVYKVK